MTLPMYERSVVVAFTQAAWQACFNRFGRYDIVITWDQCQAWAAGIAEAPANQKASRMGEALRYFAKKQGLSI